MACAQSRAAKPLSAPFKSLQAATPAFAATATAQLPRIDALIENAGIATAEWSLAEDNESMLTINVVSAFLLALLLLPMLKETAASYNTRPNLTLVTSDMHYTVDFKEKDAPEGIFNSLNNEKKADMANRYQISKLLEVFLVREMAARRPADSYPVTTNMTNPRFCDTALGGNKARSVTALVNELWPGQAGFSTGL
ncbi:hypothetical protein NW755_006503 [Fusarium falciforme]|uniref:Uncharacterized protein n=1 Tax=Fusarium falciforme TaxID=195108 RepID=A0A9W8R583_9HYPO|nr:hypothetical protein NW755_006503 [Fusarium falciforme]